ncbi:hypothetical protein ACG1BZ_09740 [Microbulbifer sp. CNSA002]|uniref:hypothetical protein n=1 Tax=unclassified Microbulbifer TaxID=2619833 RepID=UPI0039B598D7
MRDFNSGDINGDVVINDNSNEHKLLIHCSNEELIHEERHRQEVLEKERSRKNGAFLKFILFSATLCVAAYVWYQFNGGHSIASTLLGAVGAITGFSTFAQSDQTTEFEQRQLAALKEIHMILRERGVR